MVESVENSAGSKSLKTNKPRSFNILGCSTRKIWLHKGCIIAVIWFSLSRTLNRGQLNLDRFKFWLPTSQLLVLDVCLFDAFT
ncbi:DUF645 family protein [Vibrio cholerae]|nr:DUF645 family protein [Vibrio cholerae]